MCCKLLEIDELAKPAGVWCRHVALGRGCSIYETRPEPCRAFRCYWINQPKLDDAWKPDRSGLLLRDVGSGVLLVEVEPSKPDAWRRQPYYAQLKRWSLQTLNGHGLVVVKVQGAATLVLPDADLPIGKVADTDTISVAYEIHGGGKRPYATITAADGAIRRVPA
jgi:hypothetical protein